MEPSCKANRTHRILRVDDRRVKAKLPTRQELSEPESSEIVSKFTSL